MKERHAAYLSDLRARHARDLETLRRALAGRRPRALLQIERRQRAVEIETARILRSIA